MPSFKNQASIIAAALAVAPALVSAHGHVTSVTIDGKEFPGFQPGNPSTDSVGWSTTVTDNGFVAIGALNDDDIICHRGATNAAKAAPVAAGQTITIQWDTWYVPFLIGQNRKPLTLKQARVSPWTCH